jgi:hypothetical protein
MFFAEILWKVERPVGQSEKLSFATGVRFVACWTT